MAVSEALTKNGLVLYPNPTSDAIHLSGKVSGSITVEIDNISGQLLKSGKYEVGQSIDVKGLPSGVYIVRANQSSLKFIKK